MNKAVVILVVAVAAVAASAQDVGPVTPADVYAVVDCEIGASETIEGSDATFNIACVQEVDGYPPSSAQATVTDKPILSESGFAVIGPRSGDFQDYAVSQINYRGFFRVEMVGVPPFAPDFAPLLWVTQGQAVIEGTGNFQAWTQFLNEFGTSVATYLIPENLSFARLRPFMVGVGYDAPFDLFAECFVTAQESAESSCHYDAAAFPLLDQARFDATYGDESFRLSDYYVVRYSPGLEVVPDMDEDSVMDGGDNCTFVKNARQRDTDNDGFGNRCDADFNNDCIVNVVDLGLLRAGFFSSDPLLDLNGDDQVDAADLGLMRTMFYRAPGPSAATIDCRPPVTSIGSP